MDERSSGIIIRIRPLTETSLIVLWLTRDIGRIATVAKGARRAKSLFRGKLDLFYEGEFSFRRSRRSELHTLCEMSLSGTHPALRKDIGVLGHAAYAAALVEQTTETETPIPALFDLFKAFLDFLDHHRPRPLEVFTFEMKLLRELGLMPGVATIEISPGARQILARAIDADWPALSRLRPSESQEREIQRFLHGFLIYHLGKIPRGRLNHP